MPVAIPLAIAGATVAGAAISSNASRSAARTQSQASDRAADLQNQQFQQMLRLSMPGYQRAEGAASIYQQALGLPSTPGYGATPGGVGAQGGVGTGANMGTNGRTYPGLQAQGGAMSNLGDGGEPQINPGLPGQTPTTQPQGLDIASQVMNTPGYQAQMQQGMTAIDRASPLRGGMYSGRRMKALNDYGQQTFGGYYNDWMNRVGGMAGQSPQIAQNIGQAGQTNANNVGNLLMTGANARAQGQTNSASAWAGGLGSLAGMMGGRYG